MTIEDFRAVLLNEADGIRLAADRMDDSYLAVAEAILKCKGRVITCGVGKSGHIARKAAATFASTGTPSFFLHASEAVHGDLGMVTSQDVVLVYTYSGETDEVVRLYPSFKAAKATTIAMTGRKESTAARLADLVALVNVDREACPHDLAPTTSTTLMLAMSDALALVVMKEREFGRTDFARFHPAGALGRRLTLHVSDVMRKGEDLPLVNQSTGLKDCLLIVGEKGAGGAIVLDQAGFISGYFSDGDLRRWIIGGGSLEVTAGEIATSKPTTIESSLLAFDALEVFQNFPVKIGELPVVDDGQVVGLLVLKDLVRSGLV